MFIIGHAHEVSFKVTVMGTSAEPTVRLVLGCTPELSFPARKTSDGWSATITIPTGMVPCECPLRVEAVVNSRLFTPLTKLVELVGNEVPMVPAEEPAPTPVPDEDAVQHVAVQDDETVEFTATVQPPDETQPVPEVPRISIIQMVADREKVPEKLELPAFVPTPVTIKPIDITAVPKPQLGAIKRVVEAPSVARQLPISPKPAPAPAPEVKVSMTDIFKVAEALEPASKPTTKKAPRPVVELKTELPVRLVKGEIIYE